LSGDLPVKIIVKLSGIDQQGRAGFFIFTGFFEPGCRIQPPGKGDQGVALL
jgi:hypothetical protein